MFQTGLAIFWMSHGKFLTRISNCYIQRATVCQSIQKAKAHFTRKWTCLQCNINWVFFLHGVIVIPGMCQGLRQMHMKVCHFCYLCIPGVCCHMCRNQGRPFIYSHGREEGPQWDGIGQACGLRFYLGCYEGCPAPSPLKAVLRVMQLQWTNHLIWIYPTYANRQWQIYCHLFQFSSFFVVMAFTK